MDSAAIDYEAPFIGVDDLPRHLRTCAAMSPEVELILPARVALQLARRIEAGRAVPTEPVAFIWLDRHGQVIGLALMLAAVLIAVGMIGAVLTRWALA